MPDKYNFDSFLKTNNFLDGIYNYCDRWCEKCIYTERCATYSMSEKYFPNNNLLSNPKEFFEQLRKIFEETKNMLEEKLEEFSIEEIPQEDLLEAELIQKSIDERIETNPLVLEARKYADLVHYWFDENSEILKRKEKEFNSKARLGLLGYNLNDAQLLNEVFEVIHFYRFFITAKVMRAFRDKYEIELDALDAEEDMLTSAKLFLLAITRSIAAWQILYDFLPEVEKSIFDLLLLLDRIRIKLQEIFPKAWEFKRPYFD